MSWTNTYPSSFYERFLRRQSRQYEFIEGDRSLGEYQTQLGEFS